MQPTPDRVRETVFNWLADAIPASACLDLFAGTGALGLESLSRGAREAWLVERDAALAGALRKRVDALHADARVLQMDVEAFLRGTPTRSFDIVFVDPPYRRALEPLLGLLAPWLADRAQIYVERPGSSVHGAIVERLAGSLPGLEPVKQARAGGIVFGLLRFRRS